MLFHQCLLECTPPMLFSIFLDTVYPFPWDSCCSAFPVNARGVY